MVDVYGVIRRVLATVAFTAVAGSAMAQSAENVAVVINDASSESRRIGEYYARARSLPPSNVLHLQTSTEEVIERDAYVRTIEQPLAEAIQRAGLQDRLLYLVLTKGIPLRVAGSTGLKGTQASVDSEVTLLYRRLSGQTISPPGAVDNPYYLGVRDIADARPFSHHDHDFYLVTRLDAFTVEEALAIVDRAQAAGSAGKDGKIVLDQRAAPAGPRSGDEWLERAAKRIEERGDGQRVLLESTTKAARAIDGVLGYHSWGAADPENRVRSAGMTFVPGAIAATLASFDARTMREPPADWLPSASSEKKVWFEGSADTLIADLIRAGVTGVAGQVGEAYVLGAVRPEILYPAYLAGFNLAEAFYLATPTLSWQAVVIGDPLMAPFRRAVLTRQEIEGATDGTTGLPEWFAKRRFAAVKRANPSEQDRVIELVLRTETLLAQGDKNGARRVLEEAVESATKPAGLLITLAILEEELGEHDAAIGRYRRVLETEPDAVVALNNLAFALAVRRKMPAEALPYARHAAKLAPQAANVLDTLAWIEHLLGNDAEATKLLAEAIKRDPAQADIRLHAAVVYAALGDKARAEMELKEALRLDPRLESTDEVRQVRAFLSVPQ